MSTQGDVDWPPEKINWIAQVDNVRAVIDLTVSQDLCWKRRAGNREHQSGQS